LLKNFKVGFVAAVLLAGSMWFYVQHVLIAHQVVEAKQYQTPRGNLSDIYPRWLGARELLLHHRDPYSAEVTREIQEGYYGRSLDPGRPNDPRDQQAFAYPVYVAFLLAPTVNLPFPAVQAGFRWFLALLTIASVLLWLRALRWRPSFTAIATMAVLTLGSFPVLQGIKLQQLSLMVAGLIAGSILLIAENDLFSAGLLLALATIKPQLVLPLAAWLIFWSLNDFRRRQRFIWGFISTLAILFAASEYVLPGWLGRFGDAVISYRQYTEGAESILDVLLTPFWGKVLAVLMLLALAVLGWRLRRTPAGSATFNALVVLILAATVVIVPKTAPYNQVLLIPAILFLLRHWSLFWSSRLGPEITVISAFVVAWPWLAALGLALGSLFLPQDLVQQAWAVPLYTSLIIPPALTSLMVAYFTRSLESNAATV
jgi:hypothetical protein